MFVPLPNTLQGWNQEIDYCCDQPSDEVGAEHLLPAWNSQTRAMRRPFRDQRLFEARTPACDLSGGSRSAELIENAPPDREATRYA